MRHRALLGMSIALALAGLAGTQTPAAAAQIGGQVVDGEGRPVGQLTLRFVQRATDFSSEITTRKNGRFVQARLPAGEYMIATGDPTRFIATLDYELKNADGLTVGQASMDGHPKLGAGPVPFSGRSDVKLMLVVALRDSDEAYRRQLSFAAPELNALVALYEQEQYREVVEAAGALLARDAELGEAHYMQGIAFKSLEQTQEARAALDRAAESIPDYPGIWGELGDTLLDLAGEHQEAGAAEAALLAYRHAAEALTRAVEREPESAHLQADLANALDHAGEHERLVPVLERVLELRPDNLQARLRLAALLSESGDQQRAMALLAEIPDTEPRAAVTLYNVAVRLFDEGHVDGSLVAARRAAEIDPALPQAHKLLIQIHLARSDHPAAAGSIRRFLELAPDDPKAEMYRGILAQLESP